VFLGLTALSFDLGRLASTQSELQSFADHVALAAAGELDGAPDAIIRANAAAANLITGTQTFGQGGPVLDENSFTLSYHATLPPNDATAMGAATNDPRAAAYVAVTVNPRTVRYTFARAFAALSGQGPTQGDVGAVAVAGFTTYACDITPLMICLPADIATNPLNPGTMIQAQAAGGSGAWGPGNWGWLRPSGGFTPDPSGPCGSMPPGQIDRCLLAAQNSVTTCFAQRGVDTDPGRSLGITEAAINARFDVWRATMNGERNNAHYAPAPNTISGWARGNNGCVANNESPQVPDRRLPRDACFNTSSCGGNGRYGNGEFAAGLLTYYQRNYGGVPAWAPVNPQTRYDVYLAEIESAGGPNSTTRILPTSISETGRGAQCSPHQSTDVERRVLVVAGIDCTTNVVQGNSSGVPVQQFYRVFMTEPAQDFDIWLEVIGSASFGGAGHSKGIIHDVVQLYR